MGSSDEELCAVDVTEPVDAAPAKQLPEYNGFGSLEDSAQNCTSLVMLQGHLISCTSTKCNAPLRDARTIAAQFQMWVTASAVMTQVGRIMKFRGTHADTQAPSQGLLQAHEQRQGCAAVCVPPRGTSRGAKVSLEPY